MSDGTLWGGLADGGWQAVKGCYPYPGFCFASSAAGEIYLSGLSLSFAEGESAAGVKTSFALPGQLGEAAIHWSSSNPEALKVENGQAVGISGCERHAYGGDADCHKFEWISEEFCDYGAVFQ